MNDGSTDQQVEQLDRVVRESQERLATLRRAQTAATLGLVAVFVVAAAALWSQARSMYTAEKFQASLAPQMEQLRPQLETTVRHVVDRAAPHYARLGQERLDSALPALGAAVRTELDGMSASLAARAERRISDAFEAIEQKQLARLRAVYPDLDEQHFRELRTAWARDVQTDTEDVIAEFHERAMTDFTMLGTTIESFGPNRFDDMPRDELVRYYAHLWLTLVDERLLEGIETAAEPQSEQGGRDG